MIFIVYIVRLNGWLSMGFTSIATVILSIAPASDPWFLRPTRSRSAQRGPRQVVRCPCVSRTSLFCRCLHEVCPVSELDSLGILFRNPLLTSNVSGINTICNALMNRSLTGGAQNFRELTYTKSLLAIIPHNNTTDRIIATISRDRSIDRDTGIDFDFEVGVAELSHIDYFIVGGSAAETLLNKECLKLTAIDFGVVCHRLPIVMAEWWLSSVLQGCSTCQRRLCFCASLIRFARHLKPNTIFTLSRRKNALRSYPQFENRRQLVVVPNTKLVTMFVRQSRREKHLFLQLRRPSLLLPLILSQTYLLEQPHRHTQPVQ